MRLDWFLHSLRNPDRARVAGPAWLFFQVASRVCPRILLSDPATGRVGLIRRVLQFIGPTWASSPFRRFVQTAFLVLFVWLFVHVCWPYTAKPTAKWHNWLPVEVDVQTGHVTVASEEPVDDSFSAGVSLYVGDASRAEDPALGLFRVTEVDAQELRLEPVEPLSRKQLDELAASFGPWFLAETDPGSWPSHYSDDFHSKEQLPGELFLILDPLVSVSTAIAARCWIWSLAAAAVILAVCVLIPRGFCAYICPLGTTIDLFDWALSQRVRRFRVAANGWWVHLKYYLLLGTLVASVFGVLLSGFVAAIPIVTRAFAFLWTPFATGMTRDWHQIPPPGAGQMVSIALFLVLLGLGLLKPRFWCKYVCPTGAMFSVGNLFGLTQRKVESTCIHCNQCVEICPFDAIKADFTTRTADCTFCQACGGVCPTHSIKFVDRWNQDNLKEEGDPPTEETAVGRRGFLAATAGGLAGTVGGAGFAATVRLLSPPADASGSQAIVRPPGSVPEREFLQLCVRCGECYQACPNNVLQPVGLETGFEPFWTPKVVANWSGCEPSCSNCGQVCPTGAIRPLPLEEKRVARMGLAVVNQDTCLPYAGRQDCQLCVDECVTAGYNAIEFIRVGRQQELSDELDGGGGFLAPTVLSDKCVGCGLCQTRCYAINVKAKELITESAIVVEAGPGNEDRLMHGSYVALREQEKRQREEQQTKLLEQSGSDGGYLPDFLK